MRHARTSTDQLAERIPECGPWVAAVQTACGVEAVILGKPHPAGIHLAAREMGFELDEVVIVGDNLTTDIACGIAAGIATVLTLTGVTSQAQIANCSDGALPDLIIQNLCERSFIDLFV